MSLIGRSFGAYRIMTPLAAGGMGEVYVARDQRLGRDVAVKVLRTGLADDPERVARFRQEAQMLAALNHPNIATIYGLEEWDQSLYLVMELVRGQTLAERMAQGRVPLWDVLRIGRQLAEALAAAHEQGNAHRDVKPSNIKVSPDGRVKVLDFGVAKRIVDECERPPADPSNGDVASTSWTLLGTPAYMSPERVRGEPSGQASDIWAFGCVLYELLTGRKLFASKDVFETIASVLLCEPDWTALPLDTPRTVRALIRRCLEKDSRRRLPEIGCAQIMLDGVLACAIPESPLRRRSLQTSRPFGSWARRHGRRQARAGTI